MLCWCMLQGLQAQQAAQPAAQQAGPQPGAATQNGQPDYSAQWAEYYRSIGKVKEAEAIEAQMKAAKVIWIKMKCWSVLCIAISSSEVESLAEGQNLSNKTNPFRNCSTYNFSCTGRTVCSYCKRVSFSIYGVKCHSQPSHVKDYRYVRHSAMLRTQNVDCVCQIVAVVM